MTRAEIEKLDFDLDTRRIIVSHDIRRLIKWAVRASQQLEQYADQRPRESAGGSGPESSQNG